MENEKNVRRPQLNYGRRFWHIWGPFIIDIGIGVAVSMAAMTACMVLYVAKHTGDMAAVYDNQEKTMEIIYTIMMQHMTELEGITAFITIPVMLFLYYRDRKQERMLGIAAKRKVPASKYIMAAVLAGTLSMALNNLILIGNLSSYSAAYQDTAEALYSASVGMQIVCLGLLSPIAEELVFRGLMYRRMREDTKAGVAIVYTAVVFGLFHGNTVQIIYATAMGIMLAYLCEKYGSVLAPAIAHVTANLISIFATYFKIYDKMISNIVIIGAVTVACATIAAAAFLVIRQMEGKEEV